MMEAMESSINGGFSHLQSYGDSSEEELSVLPRHTKVVVTGNNRTKSVLVGLQGVVKKAVGLGGWHWLVLTNGIEVKLQRNALSVIEAPTGHEEDDDLDYENGHWNASDMTSDDTQKSHRSRHRVHKSSGSYHKTMSRTHSCDSQSKGSISTRGSTVRSPMPLTCTVSCGCCTQPIKRATHRCCSKTFHVSGNGRVAGYCGIRPGRKETEDRLQVTGRGL
ncbi:hypothetical protein ACJRO7_023456 [Eucalyptus globulus]|uniref:Histone deacetylase complex subunit SAP30 Sin3 binding domain-containing protein n=1 Tax=Eucalyptus globulus TaxID=34317 RepID=A0ABD3K6F7_EUCGL